MYHQPSGPTMTEKNDDRITRIGNFLRKSRIDEIPQLFNVLKGDMSIVGPRPERPYFVDKYKEEIEEAYEIMKDIDEKDTEFLALAISYESPIWSDDGDFQEQEKVDAHTSNEVISEFFR